MVQLLHPYMTPGKTIALTIWTFVSKVMSLIFNRLSRFGIAFLPRSKCLLISWVQLSSAVILEPKKIKSVSTFPPFICHEVMGPDAMILVFWMLSFKPAFSVSSFTFIKGLFSSSSLSVKAEAPILWPPDVKSQLMGKDHGAEKDWGQVSSAYLRLLIFLPAILIPNCPSSSLAFHKMYSAYKLNKQGDNIHPWHIPFPILNQSAVPSPVLLLLDLQTGFSGGR